MIVEETIEKLLQLHLKAMAEALRETMMLPGAEALNLSIVVADAAPAEAEEPNEEHDENNHVATLASRGGLRADMPTSSPTS